MRWLWVLPILMSGCAFGSADDDPDNTDKVCESAPECPSGQTCNLVTRRCVPDGRAGTDQLRVQLRCVARQSEQTDIGDAFVSANFDGTSIDFGAGCIYRDLGELWSFTIIGGDGSRAVILNTLPISSLGDQTIPGSIAAYLESYDGDRLHPLAYASAGSLNVSATGQEIRAELEASLITSLELGVACEPEPLRCGSPGAGAFCMRDDPSGTQSCRAVCDDSRPCGSEESCVPSESGLRFCVPTMDGLIGAVCTTDADCRQGLCAEGRLGEPNQSYCRVPCDADGDDYCGSGPEVCLGFANRMGGVCLPDPCTLLDCGTQGCKPASHTEASCVDAGHLSGSFSSPLGTSDSVGEGSASGSGSLLGRGAWQSNSTAIAFLLEGTNGQNLVVGMGSGDASDRRDLWLFIPIIHAKPLAPGEDVRRLIVAWEFEAAVLIDQAGGQALTEASGISGTVSFSSLGDRVGASIVGSFDLYFEGGSL